MLEAALVKLMGRVDIKLLENEYIEKDLDKQIQSILNKSLVTRRLKRDQKFSVTDSLQKAIDQQLVLMELDKLMEKEWELPFSQLGERLEIKVGVVQKKFRHVVGIVSGITTMVVVAGSIILISLRKKAASQY